MFCFRKNCIIYPQWGKYSNSHIIHTKTELVLESCCKRSPLQSSPRTYFPESSAASTHAWGTVHSFSLWLLRSMKQKLNLETVPVRGQGELTWGGEGLGKSKGPAVLDALLRRGWEGWGRQMLLLQWGEPCALTHPSTPAGDSERCCHQLDWLGSCRTEIGSGATAIFDVQADCQPRKRPELFMPRAGRNCPLPPEKSWPGRTKKWNVGLDRFLHVFHV